MALIPSNPRVAIAIELHWNLPWHLDCFQGISDYGKEHGWSCVVDPYLDGPTGDGDLTGYDGVVGRLSSQNAKQITAAGLPGVNQLTPEDDHGLHSVRVDAIASTQLAGEHLIAHGYRRFGHVSPTTEIRAYSDPIISMFAQTVTSHGLPKPAVIEIKSDSIEQAETLKACLQTLTDWIQSLEKPVGVYVYLYDLARYLTQICAQIGIRIPEDVGLVVLDADTVNSPHVTPTLSAIEFDFWEQGYQAAAVLDRLMRGERVEPRNKLIPPGRVIARESTDIFVCEDELISQAMRFIADRCRQAISTEEVAAALEVSRRTLDRRFEEVLGKTVSQAIAGQRVTQIEGMLIESALSMTELAELFSFGSASLFTQFFKRHTGVTPTAYRERHQRSGQP